MLLRISSMLSFWRVRFIFLHSSTIVSVAELTHPNLPEHNKLILCKKMKRTPFWRNACMFCLFVLYSFGMIPYIFSERS